MGEYATRRLRLLNKWYFLKAELRWRGAGTVSELCLEKNHGIFIFVLSLSRGGSMLLSPGQNTLEHICPLWTNSASSLYLPYSEGLSMLPLFSFGDYLLFYPLLFRLFFFFFAHAEWTFLDAVTPSSGAPKNERAKKGCFLFALWWSIQCNTDHVVCIVYPNILMLPGTALPASERGLAILLSSHLIHLWLLAISEICTTNADLSFLLHRLYLQQWSLTKCKTIVCECECVMCAQSFDISTTAESHVKLHYMKWNLSIKIHSFNWKPKAICIPSKPRVTPCHGER